MKRAGWLAVKVLGVVTLACGIAEFVYGTVLAVVAVRAGADLQAAIGWGGMFRGAIAVVIGGGLWSWSAEKLRKPGEFDPRALVDRLYGTREGTTRRECDAKGLSADVDPGADESSVHGK